jgi:hypothetical protein
MLPWRIQLLVALKESSADREKLHQKREAHNDKKKLQLTRTVHNSLGLQPIVRMEQRENQLAIDRSQILAFRLAKLQLSVKLGRKERERERVCVCVCVCTKNRGCKTQETNKQHGERRKGWS